MQRKTVCITFPPITINYLKFVTFWLSTIDVMMFHSSTVSSPWFCVRMAPFFLQESRFFFPLYLVEMFSLCTWWLGSNSFCCTFCGWWMWSSSLCCKYNTTHPMHHKRLRGCRNCEQAFFVQAKVQQMSIFSIGKNLDLFHCQFYFLFF